MGRAPLKCNQAAAREIYNYFEELDRSGAFPPGLGLDSGYRVLDYQNFSDPDGKLKNPEVESGPVVQCQELWENGLKVLDRLGEMADWEENPRAAKDETHREAIEKYQAFRRLVECQTGQPIPWVFEAPYICDPEISAAKASNARRDITKLGEAKKIRDKVRQAIGRLEILLSDLKETDGELYKRRMIVGLYWFVWMEHLPEASVFPEASRERSEPYKMIIASVKEKIIQTVSNFKNRIRFIKMIDSLEWHDLSAFAEYLLEHGGLGMSSAKGDAPLEATALEMAATGEIDPQTGRLVKRGWCTEQSKVLYAVLRMAGIEAFFVDPALSASYLKAKNILGPTRVPIPGHTATGVGVNLEDKKGNAKPWVLDMALGMPRADYILAHPRRWEPQPFWKLTLRHYWMVDLSNLGADYYQSGAKEKAEENYQLALQLGEDSTAYYALGNYGYWLCDPFQKFLVSSLECKNAYYKIRKSLKVNPRIPLTQIYKGEFLARNKQWKQAMRALLRAIEIDPRFSFAYQSIGLLLCNLAMRDRKELTDLLKKLNEEMQRIIQKPPSFQDEVKKGFNTLKIEIANGFKILEDEIVKSRAIGPTLDREERGILFGLHLSRDELLNEIKKIEENLKL